ncbi:MAG: hypothetical protein ABL921_33880, partial [Pirellula sp.]
MSGNLAGDMQLVQNATVSSLNVRALGLNMLADANANATGFIGLDDQLNGAPNRNRFAIDTQVGSLAATSAQGIYILESDGVSVTTLAANAAFVQEVNFNASLTPVAIALSSGLTTTAVAAPIKLQNILNDIVVDASITSVGSVLIQTLATNGDILVNTNISSAAGAIHLSAGDDLRLNANVVSGGGRVYVHAANGSINGAPNDGIVMGNVYRIATTNANIYMETLNEGDIRLGLVDAGNATVGIRASGSIFDGNLERILTLDAAAGQAQVTIDSVSGLDVGDIVSITSDFGISESFTIAAIVANTLTLSSNLSVPFGVAQGSSVSPLNVRAANLSMIADSNANGTGSIGQNETGNGVPDRNRNAINTQVNLIAARSAQGIYVQETNGFTVSTIAAVPNFVDRVNFNSSSSAVALAALSGLTTTVNGPIKIQSTFGDIVVLQPIDADGFGTILIQSLVSGNILIGEAIHSDLGTISLKSAGGIDLNGPITGGGTADLSLIAAGDIRIFRLLSVGGDAYLQSGGSILNLMGATTNIRSNFLQLRATGFIGLPDVSNINLDNNANAIYTDVQFLAAQCGRGIYIQEFDGLTVTETPAANFTSVNFNSTNSPSSVSGLSGLVTLLGGSIKLQSQTGDIVVARAITANGIVDATGDGIVDGDILLQTLAGDIQTNAIVSTDIGNVSVRSFDDIRLNSQITVSSSSPGKGTVYVFANNANAAEADPNGVTMAANSVITTAGAN